MIFTNFINILPLDKQEICKNTLIKIYNSELSIVDKIYNIIFYVELFVDEVDKNNIISYDFKNK